MSFFAYPGIVFVNGIPCIPTNMGFLPVGGGYMHGGFPVSVTISGGGAQCKYCHYEDSNLDAVDQFHAGHELSCRRYFNGNYTVNRVTCRSGHALSKHSVGSQVTCDECRVDYGGCSVRCTGCDYDICPRCLATKEREEESKAGVEKLRRRMDAVLAEAEHRSSTSAVIRSVRTMSYIHVHHGITKAGMDIASALASKKENNARAEQLLIKLKLNVGDFSGIRSFDSLIATTGQSVLFKGTFGSSREAVAIKVFYEKHADSGRAELAMLARCASCLYIVSALKGYVYSGLFVMLLPLAQCDLAAHIEERSVRRDFHGLRRFAAGLAEGLLYLHRNNIAHLDFKCENCLVFAEVVGYMIAKIADFGFSKEFRTNNDRINYCGTPYFIAPEIWNEVPRGDFRKIDVFAFGGVLYQLLTAQPPLAREWSENAGGMSEVDFLRKEVGSYRKTPATIIDSAWDRTEERLFANIIRMCCPYDASSRATMERVCDMLRA
jgi:serine/threonine protein kinase